MDINQLKNKFIKAGMDDVVLARQTNNSTQIKFANNRVVKTGIELIDQISIFLVKDKKLKETYDKKVDSIDQIDLVDSAINASLAEGTKRTNGIFETHDVDSHLVTSNHVDIKDKQTSLYFSIRSLI